jgi:formylglycine-generating enzyme required for sulfatase activity
VPPNLADPDPPDVFLALGGSRRAAAVEVAELLRRRGWRVRLDADLTDQDWTTGLTGWIKAARAIVVFLPSDWADARWLRHELPLIDERKQHVSVQAFAEVVPRRASESPPYTQAWAWRRWDPAKAQETADAVHAVLAQRLGAPEPTAAAPRPSLPDSVDAHRAALNLELRRAHTTLAEAARRGTDLAPLRQEILRIKRALNEGPSLESGMVLDHYELHEKVGSGGFGTVWRAWDLHKLRTVALKVLHPNRAEDRSRLLRFFRGAREMAALVHPYVVRVLAEHGEDRGFHYYVMELVPRGDLHAAVTKGDLGTAEALERVLEAGEALAVAHERHVIHRDVKPHNILIGDDGRARITDFDLVKAADTTGATKTGALGTWLYVSPEATDKPGVDVDAKADVYGLAMTAAFCIQRADPGTSAMFQREAWLRSLKTGEAVRAVVAQGLALEPGERLGMREFVEGLREAVRRDLVGGVVKGRGPVRLEQTSRARIRFELPDGLALEMALLPAGTFVMGSSEGVGESSEHPAHKVRLTRPFAMGVTPVTQAQWRAVILATRSKLWPYGEYGLIDLKPQPSRFNDGSEASNRPVEHVSWLDAVTWCNALSVLAGRRPVYRRDGDQVDVDPDGDGLRLPTEAEWEYACRAGTSTRWWHGDDAADLSAVAWYGRNAEKTTHPVGEKPANPWGLHDMLGNVWEWCWDWFDPSFYARSPTDDPAGPLRGANRTMRGGSGWGTADGCRTAYRSGGHPDGRGRSQGFRVVLPAPARDP